MAWDLAKLLQPFEAETFLEHSWQRSPLHVWPLRRPALKALALAFVLLLAVWSAAGSLFMWLLDDGPVGDLDRDVSRWFEDQRTERLDRLAEIGSGFSDTLVKVILVALVGAVMVAVWKRWHATSPMKCRMFTVCRG